MNLSKAVVLIVLFSSIAFSKSVADFVFNPYAGDAPLNIYLNASSSIGAVDYKWIIDDELTLYGIAPVVPLDAGRHNITLVVSDDEGSTDSVTKFINLTEGGLVYNSLDVKPIVFDNSTGLYKFSAVASENGFCQNTTVSIDLNGYYYLMDKGVDCNFTKYLDLPVGDYVVHYKALYGDSERNAFSRLSVDSGSTAFIKVYSPQAGTSFKKDAVAYVEAVFVYGVKNIRSGTGVVRLVGENGSVFNEQKLSLYYPGAFKGFIPLNVSSGNYSLLVEIKYKNFDLVKKVPIIVSENQSKNSISVGPSIFLVEPGKFNYPLNSSVSFEINFFDENGMLISNADAVMKVIRLNESIASINMTKGLYSYDAMYFFNESGVYNIVFDLKKGNEKATKSIVLIVGNSTQLGEVENFTASFLSPLPEVYVENSSLNVRILVKKGSQRISNASVLVSMNNASHNMSYDNFGEYVWTTPMLPSGKYNLMAVADYGKLKAVAETSFEISSHVLRLLVMNPSENQSIELNKSKGIVIKADLIDETNESVPDALVTAEIVEPRGRTIKVDLKQNQDTKVYEGIFYPNEEGVYKVSLSAYEPGFVASHNSISFHVSFYKKQIQISQFDLHGLLIIAVAVLILILVIILLRLVF